MTNSRVDLYLYVYWVPITNGRVPGVPDRGNEGLRVLVLPFVRVVS